MICWSRTCPELYKLIEEKLSLTGEELELMQQAAQWMYLPYDEKLGINLQDDHLLERAEWDFEHTPKEHHPLLLFYHPLKIYRYNVLKQADTLLAHLLLDDEKETVMKKSFDYYERLTTHDSSLSPCVHSMMALRVNYPNKAHDYFMETVMLDLDNLHNNTKDGLHIANAGGAYMTIVYGFGGLRIKEDGIHIRPSLPKEWHKIAFRLNYQGIRVKITIRDTVLIEAESPIEIFINDCQYKIENSLEVAYIENH